MSDIKTVLIIDDEEDLCDTVGYKFQSNGCHVVTAADGIDGLHKLETLKPDLIILDINMPVMNGLDFYHKIKGTEEKPKYPVLVLTARANMEQLFRDLDVDGFMAKPFELDELFQTAENILKKYSGSIAAEDGSGQIRARKVCIVEKDPAVFNALAVAFLERGYVVNSAQSGASAIKRITMDVPDIAVVALELTDLTGDITIGKLYRLTKTKNVKYILYTPKTTDVDKTVIAKRISEKDGVCRLVQSNSTKDLLDAADELFQ